MLSPAPGHRPKTWPPGKVWVSWRPTKEQLGPHHPLIPMIHGLLAWKGSWTSQCIINPELSH